MGLARSVEQIVMLPKPHSYISSSTFCRHFFSQGVTISWQHSVAFQQRKLIKLIKAINGFIYNSLVFSSLSGNEYYYSVVTEDFLTGAPFNLTGDWQPRFMQDPKTGMIPKISKTQGPPNGAHVDPFDVAIAVERLQTMVELYSNMKNEVSTWERLENK
ncbi:uncharacterized protein RCO7_07971 [Rhynchosporium graminicola]|uniref:Uncharacterized protein n=1 Tax=Rhynchosporium graminicola TaxID=2792576 RepID=A0A1E1KRY9_9HELO|nr:uncharacterized protein RCO7_07971 [Rhynchosporium commune]